MSDDPQTIMRGIRLAAMREYLGPEVAACEPAWKQDMRDILWLYDAMKKRAEAAERKLANIRAERRITTDFLNAMPRWDDDE